jgi:hypothetical protein
MRRRLQFGAGSRLKCDFYCFARVWTWRAGMGAHYSHIDLAERRQIQDMVAAGVPVAVIARRLGRHRSMVHREIGGNFHHTSFRDRWGKDYRGYYCLPADDSACRRRGHQAKLTRRGDLREHVIAKLRSGWSPQQSRVGSSMCRTDLGQCRTKRSTSSFMARRRRLPRDTGPRSRRE